MKKSTIFWIVASILILIMLTSLVYHVFYFRTFGGETREISDGEKQKVIGILNNSGVNYTQITFGKVYSVKGRDIIHIELTLENSKKYYFVDIQSEKVVKK